MRAARSCADHPGRRWLLKTMTPMPSSGAKASAEWNGHDAGLANSLVIPLLAKFERQTHARDARIWLEVQPEHRRQGLGPQHRVLLAGDDPQQGSDVANHVSRAGIHPAPARRWNLPVSHRLEAAERST